MLSDGWGGHREALVQVYGRVPDYQGRGRPLTIKRPQPGWHYTQMVKQRDDTGNQTGIKVRVTYGDDTTLDRTGEHSVHVERTNLTSRHMNGRYPVHSRGVDLRANTYPQFLGRLPKSKTTPFLQHDRVFGGHFQD